AGVAPLDRAERRAAAEPERLVAVLAGQLDPAARQLEALVAPRGAGALESDLGVAARELRAGRQPLEQREGRPAGAIRLDDAPGAPEELREAAEHAALAEHVGRGAVVGERLLERGDAVVVLVGDVALGGALLEQRGALGGRQPAGAEAHRPGELRGRLAVRADLRGLPGGGGGELDDG